MNWDWDISVAPTARSSSSVLSLNPKSADSTPSLNTPPYCTTTILFHCHCRRRLRRLHPFTIPSSLLHSATSLAISFPSPSLCPPPRPKFLGRSRSLLRPSSFPHLPSVLFYPPSIHSFSSTTDQSLPIPEHDEDFSPRYKSSSEPVAHHFLNTILTPSCTFNSSRARLVHAVVSSWQNGHAISIKSRSLEPTPTHASVVSEGQPISRRCRAKNWKLRRRTTSTLPRPWRSLQTI